MSWWLEMSALRSMKFNTSVKMLLEYFVCTYINLSVLNEDRKERFHINLPNNFFNRAKIVLLHGEGGKIAVLMLN